MDREYGHIGHISGIGMNREYNHTSGTGKNLKRKKNRKNIRKQRLYISSTVLVLAIVLMITMSNSQQIKANEKFKSSDRIYSSILIEEGDTLWNIAQEYKPEGVTVSDYIQSVKKINGLHSDDIHSGNYLIIYYYAKD